MAKRREALPRARDVLSTVLQRIDPDHELQVYRLWTFWDDEVGATIARRAQPTRFRNGILFVSVATHAWMQELQFMKEMLRERLNTRLGTTAVRDIYFVSGTFEERPAAPPAEIDDHPGLHGEVTMSLPSIADPAIAAAFTRVMTARGKRITAARSKDRPPRRDPKGQ